MNVELKDISRRVQYGEREAACERDEERQPESSVWKDTNTGVKEKLLLRSEK